MKLNRRDLLLSGGASGMLTLAGPALAQNAQPAAPAAPAATPNAEASTAAAEPATSDLPPDNEKKIKIISLRDLEAAAEKVMTPSGFAFVAGGAGDEWTMRENLAAFDRWVISPDYLSGHDAADTTATILGTRLSYPAITPPMGLQGSVHAQKEAPAVKGSALAGTLFCASSLSQISLEDIAATTDAPKWFQIYMPENRSLAAELLQRAKASGYKAIILTVDAFLFSNRERSMRLEGRATPNLGLGNIPKTPGLKGRDLVTLKASLNWSDVEFCRQQSGLPVIVKSVLSPSHALEAARRGCAAVWLSNHGGRQLDNTPSAVTMLPRVAAALKGRIPIIADGGVRRGQDVFRALALGANVVALGRPVLYGAALGGAQGVQAVHDHLRAELVMTMRLAGTPTIKSITRNSLLRAEA